VSRVPAVALSAVLIGALAVPLTATATPTTAPGATTDKAKVGARADRGFGPAERAAALRQARAEAPRVAKALDLGSRERLVARSVEQDVNGTRHVRYDRTVGGLEVVGGDLVVHRAPNGKVRSADFASKQPLAAVPTRRPMVRPDGATRVAVARDRRLSPLQTRLVVWTVEGLPRPAWRVELAGTDRQGGPVRRVEFVDATTGKHIAGWSLLQHVDGDGRSLYSGTVPLTTIRKGGQFQMKDNAHGGGRTVDVNNGTDPTGGYLAGTIFKDADNHWGNGRAANRQTAAVDVTFGTAQTWDYFETNFGRQGIRDDGVGAKSRVHYGSNYDNAFWDDGCFCMTYGDGGTAFKPLVSLDIAGHEMTHGVTSNSAGLIYFGESGGLNESTSDIFGSTVEFAASRPSDPGDYYIGEEVTKPGGDLGRGWLRRMDQPSLDGVSYDCWLPNMGIDDPHFTSGVGNHFFYLLAEGTGSRTIGGLPHNSQSCTGNTFPGIGKVQAARIWYRALTVYMTSTTSYIDARDATIRAALDLFPADPTRCAAVDRAWAAVEVPAEGYWSCSGMYNEGASTLGPNPGFESGGTNWTLGGTTRITNNPNIGFPHTGAWWADFNGRGGPTTGPPNVNVSTLTRTVTVPNSASAVLRFHILINTAEDIFFQYDSFETQVNGTTIMTLDNRYANNTYRQYYVDMSDYAGQTVQLRFVGTEDEYLATQFLVDDLTLTPQ